MGWTSRGRFMMGVPVRLSQPSVGSEVMARVRCAAWFFARWAFVGDELDERSVGKPRVERGPVVEDVVAHDDEAVTGRGDVRIAYDGARNVRVKPDGGFLEPFGSDLGGTTTSMRPSA